MENLIYIAIVILYFVYQAYQANAKKKRIEEERRQATGMPGDYERKQEKPVSTPMTEIEDRMKEIFREMEMKSKPYAQPSKTVPPSKKIQAPSAKTLQKPAQKIQKKKEPTPFLTVDMTEEEVLPEGTLSKMAEDAFEKGKITYDYSVGEKPLQKIKFNLREAVIGNVILNRPEW